MVLDPDSPRSLEPKAAMHRFPLRQSSLSMASRPIPWFAVAAFGLSSVSGASDAGSRFAADNRNPASQSTTPAVRVIAPADEPALAVNAPNQAYVAKPGERSCAFRFEVTNASDREMLINQVRTSCGCAVAQLPAQPWHLAAGASGTVVVIVDLRAMSGVVVRTATIDLPSSFKLLTMTITVPATARKSS